MDGKSQGLTRWVRKGSLIASGAAAIVLAVLLFFFMNPLLRWGLKKAGRAAAGARVDIASVSACVLRGRLTLRGVAVADKSEPMKNLFEFDRAELAFSPRQALRAKIVIAEAAVGGLRFGTHRKKSGALASQPTTLEKAVFRQLGGDVDLGLDRPTPAQPPALDADTVSRQLFGRLAAKRIGTALYWVAWARRHAPISLESRPAAPQERRLGVDIEFPLQDSTPQFLLRRASLEGAIAAPLSGSDMKLSGTLEGVNSNPPLYGRPSALTLTGRTPDGGTSMDLTGRLDQTRKPDAAEVSFHYSGIPVEGAELGDAQLGGTLAAGTARLAGTVRVFGDRWKGDLVAWIEGARIVPRPSTAGRQARAAAQALAAARNFSVKISFDGTKDDLTFAVSSELGRAASAAVRRLKRDRS